MNFFIYPTKDTTLYKTKKLRLLNAGSDEVIELTNIFDERTGHNVSRILMQFDITSIKGVVDSLVDAKYHLNLKLMQSSELSALDTISVYPITKYWEEGTGRFIPASDAKFFSPGANWKYSDGKETLWIQGSLADASGGGDWYSGEICSLEARLQTTPRPIECEHQFNNSFSDIKLDITTIVNYWINNDIENNGIVIKFKDEDIENSGNVKFYSRQTNTVYQPYLSVSYKDYFFNPCECRKVTTLLCGTPTTPTPTPSESLVSGSLESGSLLSGSIESGSLLSGSIESGSIESGSIESGSIESGSIESGSLLSGSLESGSLLSGSLESGSLESGSLLSGSVEIVQISDFVDYSKIIVAACEDTTNQSYDDGTNSFTLLDAPVCDNLNQITDGDTLPHIKKVKKQYRSRARERILVGIREKYPTKTFSSKSDYDLNNFILDSMKYSVRDAETEEIIIDFDEYSRVCCDSSGHYFDFDFSCLSVGRIYKFLILIENEYGDTFYEDTRTFIVRA